LPPALPLGRRLQALYRSRIAELPPQTRTLLLLMALDGTGDVRVLEACSAGKSPVRTAHTSVTPAVKRSARQLTVRVVFGGNWEATTDCSADSAHSASTVPSAPAAAEKIRLSTRNCRMIAGRVAPSDLAAYTKALPSDQLLDCADLERGGDEVVICHPDALIDAWDGRAGTVIRKDSP